MVNTVMYDVLAARWLKTKNKYQYKTRQSIETTPGIITFWMFVEFLSSVHALSTRDAASQPQQPSCMLHHPMLCCRRVGSRPTEFSPLFVLAWTRCMSQPRHAAGGRSGRDNCRQVAEILQLDVLVAFSPSDPVPCWVVGGEIDLIPSAIEAKLRSLFAVSTLSSCLGGGINQIV